MFGFLKDKLKSWLNNSKKEVEKKAPKKEIKTKIAEAKPKEKKKEEKVKVEKRKRTDSEKKEERDLTKKILEGVKKEGLEIKSPEEKTEDMISELETNRELEDQKERAEIEERKEQKLGFFQRLKKVFTYTLTEDRFEEIFSELEMLLLESNVALEVVEKIKSDLTKELVGKEIKKEEIEKEIQESLKKALLIRKTS